MSWSLKFMVDGTVLVYLEKTNTYVNEISYPNLTIFQCFYGWMKHNNKPNPSEYKKSDYTDWYNQVFDSKNNEFLPAFSYYRDTTAGRLSFDLLPLKSRNFLQNEFCYFRPLFCVESDEE